MSDHISVLSDQNRDLVGHMSFSPANSLSKTFITIRKQSCLSLLKFAGQYVCIAGRMYLYHAGCLVLDYGLTKTSFRSIQTVEGCVCV